MKLRVNVGCWRARQRVKEVRWEFFQTVNFVRSIQLG